MVEECPEWEVWEDSKKDLYKTKRTSEMEVFFFEILDRSGSEVHLEISSRWNWA